MGIRQATAVSGRKARRRLDMSPSYKPQYKRAAVTQETAPTPSPTPAPTPSPVRNRTVSNIGRSPDVVDTGGPTGKGRGLGVAHGISDVAAGGLLASMGGAVLGPWGALAGLVAPAIGRGLSYGEPLGKEVDKQTQQAVGLAPATKADLELRKLGQRTYSKEIARGTGGYGDIAGRMEIGAFSGRVDPSTGSYGGTGMGGGRESAAGGRGGGYGGEGGGYGW